MVVPQRKHGRPARPDTQCCSLLRRLPVVTCIAPGTVAECRNARAPRSSNADTSTAPTAVHGLCPRRKHSSLAHRLPKPATHRWSSSAATSGRSGSAATRRMASAKSQSARSGSGPRWPITSASSRVRNKSTTGSRTPYAAGRSVRSTTRTSGMTVDGNQRPEPDTVHDPAIRMCVCKVRPPDSRVSRCLPCVT